MHFQEVFLLSFGAYCFKFARCSLKHYTNSWSADCLSFWNTNRLSDLESCFLSLLCLSPPHPLYFAGLLLVFLLKPVVYIKKKKKNHIAFLINTYFLPGPYDPLLIPIKMLFFFFAPSGDRISDQPGYATNLPAQLNPTDSERSKGLMHSLKFSTAQAGSLMQAIPLHCN